MDILAMTTKKPCFAVKRRGTVLPGARHTTKLAGNLPDSEVFSRPNTSVLGLGVPIRKDGSATNFACLYPAPPYDLDSHSAGFQPQLGAKTMTNRVIPFVRKAAPATTTTSPADNTTDSTIIARHAAIENALSAALHLIRQPYTTEAIQAATARAIRAASMLKQACSEANEVAA